MNDFKKILIIDDEISIRNSFADYLEDRNFEVLGASNGRVGLELIEKEQPDIILVDLRMPEIDGLELLKYTEISPSNSKNCNFRGESYWRCCTGFALWCMGLPCKASTGSIHFRTYNK